MARSGSAGVTPVMIYWTPLAIFIRTKVAPIAAIFLILAAIMICVPRWQAAETGIQDARERFTIENEARRTLAQIIGGLVIAVGVYYTAKRVTAMEDQVEVSQAQVEVGIRQVGALEQGQITERFTRAIEHLGSAGPTRLGGIYALERIAKDSPPDHWTVMEVLTAFVRENAPVVEANPQTEADGDPPKPAVDIQAIMTVIGRRRAENDASHRLNLSKTNLDGVNLYRANLSGAYLDEASFSRTNLNDANLSRTFLIGSRLGAYLHDTNLSGAYLLRANLTGAEGLTQEQIDSAITNEDTKLPDYLTQPDEPADDGDEEGSDDE